MAQKGNNELLPSEFEAPSEQIYQLFAELLALDAKKAGHTLFIRDTT